MGIKSITNISIMTDNTKNTILRRRSFMNNTQIHKSSINPILPEKSQIHKSFVDDVIRESMEDMGNYGLSSFQKNSSSDSSNNLENEFIDDIIKEATEDYKAGVTYGIGKKK